jgi:HEAT repeat protein
VPALAAALKNGKSHLRLAALDALALLGREAKGATPEVLAALKDKNLFVRRGAPNAVARLGADPAEAIPALAAAAKDKDSGWSAVEALGHFGKRAVPVLLAALKGGDAGQRAAVARALAAVGPDAREAVPALEAAVEDADPEVRVPAGLALWRVAGRKEEAVRVLTDLLSYEYHRAEAAERLGSMKAGAKATLPKLTKLLKDPDAAVRASAAVAVWRITGQADGVLPTLVADAKSKDRGTVAYYALNGLEDIGPAAKGAVPVLLDLLDAEEEGSLLHHLAGKALKRIDPAAAARAGVR